MGKSERNRVVFLRSKSLIFGILLFGVALRLFQYLFQGSLTLDEAYLALNVLNRSFGELLRPLDYNQGAPLGFLVGEKVLINALGDNEYVLRLVPFLCSILSLFLFYKVSKHFLTQKALPLAVGLFAISPRLLYYSSNFKQYSSDVLVALLIVLMIINIKARELSLRRILSYGLLGAILLWFSHPALFLLAGLGASLLLFSLMRKEWSRILGLVLIFSLWMASFALLYFLSLKQLAQNRDLLSYWSFGFMPFPPTSISDLRWYSNIFFEVFRNPLGFYLSGIAAFLFLVGLVSIFVKKKEHFLLLVAPILVVLLASALKKYPFKWRFILFLVPFLIIFIVQGFEEVKERWGKSLSWAAIILAGLLIYNPLTQALKSSPKPGYQRGIKPVIGYLSRHRVEGDPVYVYYGAAPTFEYYSKRFGFRKGEYIEGVSSHDWKDFERDLEELRGYERVWLLFSHTSTLKGIDEEKVFLFLLDRLGRRLDSFRSKGASVYLYSLRGQNER